MFDFKDINYEDFSLKLMQSDIFSGALSHYFTTRIGGDTPIPLNSFSLSAKDYPTYENYAVKNQKIICNIIGAKYENLIIPNQQHTDKIAVIKKETDIDIIKSEPFDGIITNLKNYPVCLVFADCTPILIYDKEKEIMGVIHAGWKGTAQNIVRKAIKLMQIHFKSNTNDIFAAIGPAICQNCFEVNTDVASRLSMTLNKSYDNIFLKANNNKYLVDLKGINASQLAEAGIQNIDICKYCTSCNNDIFYSYRADNKCTGRHGIIAMVKE